MTIVEPDAPVAVISDRPNKFENLSLSDFAQILTGALTLVYISGFIVVTAHLGRFGLKDYDAFRLQYLVAGAIVWVTIGLFTYFVGRHVSRLDEDADEYRQWLESMGGKGNAWAAWALFLNISELAQLLVVCTLVTGSILFPLPNVETITVAVAMFCGQQLIDMALTSRAKKHISKLFMVLLGLYFSTTVCGFLAFVEGSYRDLFFAFCFLAGGASVYQHQRLHARSPKLVTAYFVGFGLLVVSGSFGAHFYDRVRPSIGGGSPQTVTLFLDEAKVPIALKNELNVQGSISLSADVLAETATEVLVGLKKDHEQYAKMVRIKRELIVAMSFLDPRVKTSKP